MKSSIRFVLFLCLVVVIANSASAEETHFEDNIRMHDGYSVVFHNFEDDQIASIQPYQNHNIVFNAFASYLLLRSVIGIHINDNYQNATFRVGSHRSPYEISLLGDTGYIGFGIQKPIYPLHVARLAYFAENAIFAQGLQIKDQDGPLPECNEKEHNRFRGNQSGMYICRNDGEGWKLIR